ncbi:DUF6804 family protein [Ferruginibacter albus]|uniref:DUF6804 family protein n=1 Tax=Ferruginibacter albus TaxID=2875540 RepID=UPI0036F20961
MYQTHFTEMTENTIKTSKNLIAGIISIILILCLFRMQYGYYTFVRISCFILFLIMASFYKINSLWSTIYLLLAVLFNPIFPVHFNRFAWNIIDGVVAVYMIGQIVATYNTRAIDKR